MLEKLEEQERQIDQLKLSQIHPSNQLNQINNSVNKSFSQNLDSFIQNNEFLESQDWRELEVTLKNIFERESSIQKGCEVLQ